MEFRLTIFRSDGWPRFFVGDREELESLRRKLLRARGMRRSVYVTHRLSTEGVRIRARDVAGVGRVRLATGSASVRRADTHGATAQKS